MFKAHIKLSVLKELSRKSLSGYDLMNRIGISEHKPSPGYVYPLLNDLEEKGFVSVRQSGRKKVYSLAKKGKKLLNELNKNKEDMLRKMTKVLKSVADESESKEFEMSSQKMRSHFENIGMLKRFQRALFIAYKRDKKKAMKIMNESIDKMENLK